MTSEAPRRIWATEDAENHGEDRFHATKPFKGGSAYILATPTALAESPEGAKLIADAVAAERERCALTVIRIMTRYAAEKGSTKTPGGRSAIFYERKITEAIRKGADQ